MPWGQLSRCTCLEGRAAITSCAEALCCVIHISEASGPIQDPGRQPHLGKVLVPMPCDCVRRGPRSLEGSAGGVAVSLT